MIGILNKVKKKGFQLKKLKPLNLLAGLTGLEPATSCVTGRHSNQLNYRSMYYGILVGGTGLEPVTLGL